MKVVLADAGKTLAQTLAGMDPTAGQTLLIDSSIALGAWPGISVPSKVRLAFTPKGRINLGSGSLVVEGAIEAGAWQIFGNVTDVPRVSVGAGRVLPQWWGFASGTTRVTAMQVNGRALKAALASGSGMSRGPEVFIPAGDYYLDRPVTLRKGIRLKGVGKSATVLRFKDSQPPEPRPDLNPVLHIVTNDVTVEDLTIRNEGQSRTRGILVDGRATIREVGVEGFDRGVWSRSPEPITIRCCKFASNSTAILVEKSGDATIEDIQVDGPKTSNVWCGVAVGTLQAQCGMVRIRTSRFKGTNGIGILFMNLRTASVTDCWFQQLGWPVRFHGRSVAAQGCVEIGMCCNDTSEPIDGEGESRRVRRYRPGGSSTVADMTSNPPRDDAVNQVSWQVGDIITNSKPAPGEPFGWVYTQAADGSGTWKKFAEFLSAGG